MKYKRLGQTDINASVIGLGNQNFSELTKFSPRMHGVRFCGIHVPKEEKIFIEIYHPEIFFIKLYL